MRGGAAGSNYSAVVGLRSEYDAATSPLDMPLYSQASGKAPVVYEQLSPTMALRVRRRRGASRGADAAGGAQD